MCRTFFTDGCLYYYNGIHRCAGPVSLMAVCFITTEYTDVQDLFHWWLSVLLQRHTRMCRTCFTDGCLYYRNGVLSSAFISH
jgi:hypothetical protein